MQHGRTGTALGVAVGEVGGVSGQGMARGRVQDGPDRESRGVIPKGVK